ncbi:hypothetical protein C8Q75DRAFT_120549 [Abortiporus biennis]|nr:hypothetical protein C8Q75DRAFT_120549 [Abortiporus biennis]
MYCYKHAALQMIKQGHGGRIIGALSLAGKKGSLNSSQNSPPYYEYSYNTQRSLIVVHIQPRNLL